MVSPQVLTGQIISHYRVLEQIGAGGMGVIYRARDERLDRDVAIKVLPARTLADENARKRFRKEALTLSKLTHPNIAMIFDFDTQNEVDFLVMEFVGGSTLAEKVAKGALPEKEILTVGSQMVLALQDAHEQGIVHRDLKPGNIMVTPKGHLKLLDFGLAGLLRTAEGALTESLPEMHGAAGTLPYMAPEQLRGDARDFRSDIYATGAVLYEMATGQRPFPDKLTTTLTDSILHKSPPPPKTLNPSVSPKLDDIILKCLEKEPDKRYQSAKELAIDLQRLQGPVAELGGVSENLTALRRRLKIASLVVVCVLAFLFILYVGGWRKRLSSRSANPHIQSLAVLPLANLSHDSEQEYFSDGMTDELITELSKIGALRVISRTSAMHYRGTSKTLPEIARELNVEAIVEGSVVHSANQVRITAKLIDAPSERQLWAESYQRELKDVLILEGGVARDIAQQIRVKISPREETRLTARRPVDPEAHEAYLKGRHYWYKFNAESEKSGHFFEDAIAKDPHYALAYVGLANYYTIQALTSDSLRLMPKAEAAAQKALALDSKLADAHTALAAVRLYYTWDWATAEQELKIALELNPNLAETHDVYADYFRVMGQYEQAVAENIKAQRLDPLKPILNADLAFARIAVKQYKEGIEAARKALEIDPNFAMAHGAIISANELQGNYGEAAAELYDALLLDNKKALATLLQKTYESSGYATMKRVLARKQIEGANKARAKDWSPVDMATWYVQIGDNQHAFEFLEQAYHYRLWPLPLIPMAPEFFGIRSDPRYEDLVRRIGVPPVRAISPVIFERPLSDSTPVARPFAFWPRQVT